MVSNAGNKLWKSDKFGFEYRFCLYLIRIWVRPEPELILYYIKYMNVWFYICICILKNLNFNIICFENMIKINNCFVFEFSVFGRINV